MMSKKEAQSNIINNLKAAKAAWDEGGQQGDFGSFVKAGVSQSEERPQKSKYGPAITRYQSYFPLTGGSNAGSI